MNLLELAASLERTLLPDIPPDTTEAAADALLSIAEDIGPDGTRALLFIAVMDDGDKFTVCKSMVGNAPLLAACIVELRETLEAAEARQGETVQ